MKYDSNIDLSNNATSDSKLLRRVRPGSRVLEIGSAAGSMTRVLSEQMNCQVCIVEIDKDSFNVARQYASDGFCGNAEEKDWTEYYKGKKFDHIILSNILEHLKNPEKLLQLLKTYLEDSGSILISIPNATHNDVIINMVNDDFHYTETGLLDGTHLRFFGEKNYYNLIKRNGFKIVFEDRVYLDTGETEQFIADGAPELVELLKKRENGEVYQFVAELSPAKGTEREVSHSDSKFNETDRLLSEQQFLKKTQDDLAEVQKYAKNLEKQLKDMQAAWIDKEKKLMSRIKELECELQRVSDVLEKEHEAWSQNEDHYLSDIRTLQQTIGREHAEAVKNEEKYLKDIASLKADIEQYLKDIASLKADIELYTNANMELRTTINELESELNRGISGFVRRLQHKS